MTKGLQENVERFARFIADTEGDVIHVIGHSMGGVLTREVFEQLPDARPGRLIAIGSPLTDCWVGRRVGRLSALLAGRTVNEFLSRSAIPSGGAVVNLVSLPGLFLSASAGFFVTCRE